MIGIVSGRIFSNIAQERIGMSMVPMYRICPNCKHKYSWNPDVGKLRCPRCGSLYVPDAGGLMWKPVQKNSDGGKK